MWVNCERGGKAIDRRKVSEGGVILKKVTSESGIENEFENVGSREIFPVLL